MMKIALVCDVRSSSKRLSASLARNDIAVS